jgi:ABC-type dipeptide/oligopeptide/nickel transport system ATPase component
MSETISNAILRLLTKEPILHITGDPGCGKSILAQTIAMQFVEKTGKNVMYLDTMNKFSKFRFLKFFPEKATTERMTITAVNSYEQQKFLINKLDRMSRMNLLDEFGLIVIDSISHHLRHEISASGMFRDYTKAVNDFNDTQFQPLLMLSRRSNIRIILVHEMTYKPSIGTLPFLISFFEGYKGIWLPIKPNEKQKINCSPQRSMNYEESLSALLAQRPSMDEDEEEGEEEDEEDDFYQFDTLQKRFSVNIPDADGFTTIPFSIGDSGLRFL